MGAPAAQGLGQGCFWTQPRDRGLGRQLDLWAVGLPSARRGFLVESSLLCSQSDTRQHAVLVLKR